MTTTFQKKKIGIYLIVISPIEGIANLFMNMLLNEKPLKLHRSKKAPFHPSLLGNQLVIVYNCPKEDLWNHKLCDQNSFQ
jgi:hypothetical protein